MLSVVLVCVVVVVVVEVGKVVKKEFYKKLFL
jgi:hypothetical protein